MKYRALTSRALVALVVLAVFSPACDMQKLDVDDRSKTRVGIVFDIGGKDDRSFNAAAWVGAKCAMDGKLPDGQPCEKPALNILLRDVEPGNPTSIEPAMRVFAERSYNLITGIGFAQTPILERVAKDYPSVNFAIVDGVVNLQNVASLVFREHEGSYLVGMIAARASKSGIIGFIGGMDIGLIHRFAGGYEEGARAVNPNIQVIRNYVGVTDAAWNNPGKGKELALAQIGKGADVIFTAAGNSGLGAFDAVETYGKDETGRARKFVIGVDSNQNGVKPGYVLTSMVKRVDNAVYQIVQDLVNGKFEGGFHVYGLKEDGVGYAYDQYNKDLISPETIKEVEAAKQKIIAGEITVKDAMAQ